MTPEQMLKEAERLRPTPKPSTTSYCSSGEGGVTPTRTATVRERRELAVAPDNPVQTRWDQHEAVWAERERRWKEDEQRKQDEIRAREQARADAVRREHCRQQARRDLEISELLIDSVFEANGLTKNEQALVRQRMCGMGKPSDPGLAEILAQEVGCRSREE